MQNPKIDQERSNQLGEPVCDCRHYVRIHDTYGCPATGCFCLRKYDEWVRGESRTLLEALS